MQHQFPSLPLIGRCIVLVALCLIAKHTQAANVRFTVSTREAYVNEPITFQIEIENAKDFQPPTMPKIAGAAVNPTPIENSGSETTIINGRVSSRTTKTLAYRIVPFQPGTITIPPISVTADGQEFTSQPIEVIIAPAAGNQGELPERPGDLMFAEITSDRLNVYLGEPVRLRLRLWIKPYANRQFGVRLNADQTWNLIDQSATNWGDFAHALNAQRRGPFASVTVHSEEVIRDDHSGSRGAYFLYELETTIWPAQTGPIQLEQPVIVMNYPLRLARQNNFFSRGLEIVDSRPVSVNVQLPPVEVVSPPSQGKPKTFNGAVGDYSISVAARPTEVTVGDPITLIIQVVDHGDSGSAPARLNLLQAPPLDRIDELAENFRIPSDPLAGTVNGNTKVFTQTIRAKSADVLRIPPIPISFFDPETETYITRESEPLPIKVNPGSQIGVNDILTAASTAPPQARTDLKAVSGGILANYDATMALAETRPFRVDIAWLVTLALPPLLFVAVAVSRISSRFRQKNAASIRRRNAARRAIARIRSAKSSDVHAQAQAALASCSEYFTDRFNLSNRTFTQDEIANLLRERNANPSVILEIEQLLDHCEQHVYARSMAQAPADDLPDRAIACIRKLERERLE